MLSQKVAAEGWGPKTIERLAKDLASTFPGMPGFSFRSLRYMRKFAESYPDSNLAAAAAKLPWAHNMVLMDRISDSNERLWYGHQAVQNGWSRNILTIRIESDLYSRQGKAINNFKATLPAVESDLVEQTLRDPYNISFLMLEDKFRESELEQALIDHLEKFLLELGQGFAFVGRQVSLKSEILPHWRFKNPYLAQQSSEKIYEMFLAYLSNNEFTGADMARKYLQMGFTRARRYANYKGGRKYDLKNDYQQFKKGTGDPEKEISARIFYDKWRQAESHPIYRKLKREWRLKYEKSKKQ